MDFILCSAAFVICLALRVSSQLPDKPIGEWHPDRYLMYPNPWVDFTRCNTEKASGLCDVNAMLTEEQRNYFSEQPEMQEISGADRLCLCNISCGSEIRFMVTVAVMKKIGPQIIDYRAAAKEFAEKFRADWNLTSCSVILIASRLDNTKNMMEQNALMESLMNINKDRPRTKGSFYRVLDNLIFQKLGPTTAKLLCCIVELGPKSYLEAGPDLIKLLSANETERIDHHIYEKYFKQGHFVEGINETLIEYRKALWTVTETTTASEDQKNSAVNIIVGVIASIIAVVIVAIVVIAKKRQMKQAKDFMGHFKGDVEKDSLKAV